MSQQNKDYYYSRNTFPSLPKPVIYNYISNYYFPKKNVVIENVSKWSPNVFKVQVGNRSYYGKCYFRQRDMLNVMHTWIKKVNTSKIIFSTRFVKNSQGEYFPSINYKNIDYKLGLTKSVKYSSLYEDGKIDFSTLGRAIALLHRYGTKINVKNQKMFQFQSTNSEVEKAWDLQDEDERKIMDKTLTIGNKFSFNAFSEFITHNDLHPANVVKGDKNNKILVLDFDQMLVGPKGNDIGQILGSFWDGKSIGSYLNSQRVFLLAYSKYIENLNEDEITLIPFFALRKLCISLVWFKAHIHEGKEASMLYKQIRKKVFLLADYLFSQ